MAFTHFTVKKVVHGTGSVKEAPKEVRNLKGSRVLIIMDPGLAKLEVQKPLEEALTEGGIAWELFAKAELEPSMDSIQACADAAKAFGADVLIGFGGGSALDTTKAASVLLSNEGPIDRYFGMNLVPNPTMPKILIPTTAGTGSEGTPFAVITDEKTGIKYPLADYELMPNMAIIDTDYMMNQPKGLTSASGIDALTHALEAYVSIMATDYTDGIALKAVKNIFQYLPRAYENGANDPEAREKMANASTLAGMAFANAFLGVCHSMAHKLGAYHHLPHGIANALLIELVMRYNADPAPVKMGTFSQYPYPHALERYCEIARFAGIQGKDDEDVFENFIQAIAQLKETVGIKRTIKDYGVDEKAFLETLDEMVENAFNDQCTGANPRYPLMSEMKEMYLKAYYGE